MAERGDRSEARAQRAKLRRRRAGRVAGVGLVLAVVVALSVVGGGTATTDAEPKAPARRDRPALPEGCERRSVGELDPPRFDAPAQVLEPGREYRAVIETSCGDMVVDLYARQAPANVNSFVFLARRDFYRGLPFHRVEGDSVVQSGDPNGRSLDPPEGPGYRVPDELAGAHYDRYVYGVMGMANAGPDTAGSQFFIVVHDPEGAAEGDPEPAGFRPRYTIIGRVRESSWDTLARIAEVETKGGIDPVESVEPVRPVVIDSITIESRPTS